MPRPVLSVGYHKGPIFMWLVTNFRLERARATGSPETGIAAHSVPKDPSSRRLSGPAAITRSGIMRCISAGRDVWSMGPT